MNSNLSPDEMCELADDYYYGHDRDINYLCFGVAIFE